MPKNCVNRKCVLLNLAYNLALNNLLCGVATLFHGNVEELSGALIMVGLAVLLVFGVRKEERSLLLTFLILEPFLLAYHSIKGTVGVIHYVRDSDSDFPWFNFLGIVGNVVSWFLTISVYLIYKDIDKNKRRNIKDGDESKENCGNESKSVAV